jgi:hypothetical protein
MTSPLSDVFPAEFAVWPASAPGAAEALAAALPSALPLNRLPEGARRFSRVRVVAAGGVLAVFTDGPRGPERVYAAPLASAPEGKPTSNSSARALAGFLPQLEQAAWSRASGCGCGSKLRAFNPYRDAATLAL